MIAREAAVFPRALAWAGAVLASLAILAATLTPTGEGSGLNVGVLSSRGGWAALANLIRNIILFVPFGFFAFGLVPRVVVVVLAGGLLSGGVELAQFWIPGRNPLLVDLLANSFGSLLGAVLASKLTVWLWPTGALRHVLFAFTAAAAAIVVVAPAWLLAPVPPEHALLIQWNPPLGRLPYDGSVVDARFAGTPIPPGRPPADADLPAMLLAGERLEITLHAGTGQGLAYGLFRILSTDNGRYLLTLGVEGEDLRICLPYRAPRFRLSMPPVSASGILAGVEPGDLVTLTLALGHGGVLEVERALHSSGAFKGSEVDAGDSHVRVQYLPGPTAASGWSLLYFPPGIGPRARATLDFFWCAALLFAPVFFATGRRAAGAASLATFLVLLATPALTSWLMVLPLHGWAGAAVGWIVGDAARKALDGRRGRTRGPRE